MVRELDQMEKQLDAKTTKAGEQQRQLEAEVSRALAELDDVETSRLRVMKEGLQRLHEGHDGLVRHASDCAQAVSRLAEGLDWEADIARLVAEIDRPVGMPSESQHGAAHSGKRQSLPHSLTRSLVN